MLFVELLLSVRSLPHLGPSVSLAPLIDFAQKEGERERLFLNGIFEKERRDREIIANGQKVPVHIRLKCWYLSKINILVGTGISLSK